MGIRRSFLRVVAVAAMLIPLSGIAAGAESSDPLDLGPAERTETPPTAVPYVYNGEAVQNPGWIASIRSGDSFLCTASLVKPQWILTAAHCVYDADASYAVNVGSNQWFGGHSRSLATVYIHPGYTPFVLSSIDLALV
jgi:secreted trypsin-like serine protease